MNHKLFSILLLAACPHAQAALIASWNQNELSGSLTDSTGGHAAGTPVGGVAYGQPGVPNGTYGSIVVANAGGTSIGYGPNSVDAWFVSGGDNNNPVLNVPATGSLTVMGWINPSAADIAGRGYRLVSTGSSDGNDRGWGFGLRMSDAAGTSATVQWTNYGILDINSSSFSLAVGTWYHIAATYNNGALNFYLNGNLLGGSTTNLFGNESANGRLVIGARLGGNDYDQTNGRLDGIQVYNEVLTASQIQAAAISSVSVPEPGALSLAALAAAGFVRRRRQA